MPIDEGFDVQPDVRAAWRRFIDDLAPLRPDLFRYCCRLAGNVWDGEDLLQDVLIRVFGQLGKVNFDVTFRRAYLFRSATNLWIDRIRRTGLEREHAAADEPLASADASQIVDVRAAAVSLFVHLPPRERAAVLLADVMDFSLEETASMLKSTTGAIKSALHRGRTRLGAAKAVTPSLAGVPKDVVDRFVEALAARDFEAIRCLCLEDVTVDMVGGATFEGFESSKTTFVHAHFVKPEFGFGENPRWMTVDYLGEPIALGFRTLGGVTGLNEIWRFEMADDKVARLRLYCFSPDVLAAVAEDLGMPSLRRPYLSPG